MSNQKSTLDDWMGDKAEEKKESSLYDEALRLYENRRFREAFVLVNVAIEHDSSNYKYFNTKGLILRDLDRFSESKTAFDEALSIKMDSEVLENKAMMLYKWANSSNDKKQALEIISEAIEILPDNERFWYLKGSIYDCLSEPIEAQKCYLIAEGETEEVKRLEAQQDIIENSTDTLINITGTQFYFGNDIFKKGLTVDLVPEPDNPHDGDAIRVEIDGETVGYVANSDYTLIGNVKGASDIKEFVKTSRKAEIVFIYLDSYVIAKLI
ncbi:HIRAN domain-containing protein [Methanobrevibacter sp.]|uniref:HIRAN domain-containing protein n=1 Tax=Methanobrevibacter sp. TaxID=66852 RepID=UPI003890D68F